MNEQNKKNNKNTTYNIYHQELKFRASSFNLKSLRNQKGVSLMVTLIMLSAMLVISAGLYKSIDATGSVTNNISLKESGLQAAEKGVAEAVAWLTANQTNLLTNQAATGYYAAAPDIMTADSNGATKIDFTGQQTASTTDNVNWDGGGVVYYNAKKLPAKVSGFNVSYIIHRLCSTTGPYDANLTIVCSTAATTSSVSANGDSAESSEYGNYRITGQTRIAYRITARAWGPKGSSNYLQSKVLIQYN